MTRVFNHFFMAIVMATTLSSSKANLTSATSKMPHAPINSLTTIEQDMDLPGEALPYGMPKNFNWYSHPRINPNSPGGNNPKGSPAIFPWFVIFPTGGPFQATNTRVQVRNIYIYYLSKSKNTWILATGANGANGFHNSYDTNTNYYKVSVDKRKENTANGGGTSIKILPGYPFQGWCAADVGAIGNTDVAGIWAYCEARLIMDDKSLPDDRSKANLILCQGGDYKTLSAKSTGDIAIGRFKHITNSWRAFNMSTLTDAQWASVPAPPINKFD